MVSHGVFSRDTCANDARRFAMLWCPRSGPQKRKSANKINEYVSHAAKKRSQRNQSVRFRVSREIAPPHGLMLRLIDTVTSATVRGALPGIVTRTWTP